MLYAIHTPYDVFIQSRDIEKASAPIFISTFTNTSRPKIGPISSNI